LWTPSRFVFIPCSAENVEVLRNDHVRGEPVAEEFQERG